MLYNHLFKPLDLGYAVLPNRVIWARCTQGWKKNMMVLKNSQNFTERVQGGVHLIVTGGISPNIRGRLTPFAAQLSYPWQLKKHQYLTHTVQEAGGRLLLQILHAGRYGYHPFCRTITA